MANKIDFYKVLKEYLENENKDGEEARKIKRQYIFYRTNNNIDEWNLDLIAQALLEDYNSIKDIKEINEILQLIIIDYNTVKEEENNNSKVIDKKIQSIYINILGNEGTDAKGFKYKELETILKGKMKESHDSLFNRNDILNILKSCSEYDDYDGLKIYHNLLKNIVILYVDNNLENINNPKAINTLKDVALIYKEQGEYDKCQIILNKCIELYESQEKSGDIIQREFEKLLKDKEEVEDYSDKFNKIIEQIPIAVTEGQTLTDKFLSLEVHNIKDLVNGLEQEVSTEQVVAEIPGQRIPRKPSVVKIPKGEEQEEENLDDEIAKGKNAPMPVHKKIEGIQKAISEQNLTINRIVKFKELNEKNDNDILRELQSKVKDYGDYILIGIDELNVSLLECLTEDRKSIQIIPNENLYEILKFEKVRDQKINGAVTKNHMPKTFGENLSFELENIKRLRDEGKPVDYNKKNMKKISKSKETKKESIEEENKQIDSWENYSGNFDIRTADLNILYQETERLLTILPIKTKEFLDAKETKEQLKEEVTYLYNRLGAIKKELRNREK